ncbi:DUF3800 domain-containing protein [Longimicrobium sp.]|uniref:DUF3800 domain-containing protein n=1 Tax=Longimicrobium sp. TaxID=2029185 RepID=UPI002E33DF4F|nr:DUF3800 domain-containing protein [Longimicrobium sp.]HEX6041669.1 DUF3800 domain-containing protein [Longimicrobium sp.]
MTEIAYIDESYDDEVFVMSALVVPVAHWRETFEAIKTHRQHLKAVYGIFTSKELHALEFVSGRGRISERMIPKGLRAQLFRETMDMLAGLHHIRVISGAWPMNGTEKRDIHAKAFSRIAERLQKRALDSGDHILRMVDEGKDVELQKIARRSAVYNMVGSRYGGWENGAPAKNIPNDRLIEDPIFRSSSRSYFLQLADFISYALLKSETTVTPLVQRYRLNECYDRLKPIIVTKASSKDPRKLGIVRT